MLFSEPKIPQLFRCRRPPVSGWRFQCSSASRKFLNYAIAKKHTAATPAFQCSSASRKFLNHSAPVANTSAAMFQCSSASRKFLNSVTTPTSLLFLWFQCSSASRKFLNPPSRTKITKTPGFSALQRAENSSIVDRAGRGAVGAEFQCSSASRKFLNQTQPAERGDNSYVSVLFSEPKIPQSRPSHLRPSIFPTAMITLRHS